MAKYINPYTDFGFKKRFGTAELASLTAQQRDRSVYPPTAQEN